ncbi:hypothetical protein EEB14_16475 [Rhodococcus sp. WS4]|nr:hypothetical protein EEB14_16475 [Rhodococcus sp. WS4]
MITADELKYQNPPGAGYEWAETYFFPVPVPEEHLLAHVYVVVRPELGVMTNEVYVYGSLTDTRSELLHYNVRNHLPAPVEWAKLDSPMGLKITAVTPPRDYRIDYVGSDGTEIHVDWNGVMEPFDIHDPAHSPRAGRTEEERLANSSSGSAYKGHFDMTGRITGTLTIRGREFRVDCIERMDRSWGPRPEGIQAMNSINANFGDDLAFHFRAPRDLAAPGRARAQVAHGYVFDKGEVHGVVEGHYTANRFGGMLATLEAELTDTRGRHFHLHASPDVGAPWYAYPGSICWNSMMKWTLGEAVGYGVVMDNTPLDALVTAHGRWPADGPRLF